MTKGTPARSCECKYFVLPSGDAPWYPCLQARVAVWSKRHLILPLLQRTGGSAGPIWRRVSNAPPEAAPLQGCRGQADMLA